MWKEYDFIKCTIDPIMTPQTNTKANTNHNWINNNKPTDLSIDLDMTTNNTHLPGLGADLGRAESTDLDKDE